MELLSLDAVTMDGTVILTRLIYKPNLDIRIVEKFYIIDVC